MRFQPRALTFLLAVVLIAPVSPAAAQGPPAAHDRPDPPATVNVNCHDWNTQDFFATATPAAATACLALGADVAARDANGSIPLHFAAYHANPAVVTTLLQAAATVATVDRYNRTPLSIALPNGPPTVVSLLHAAARRVPPIALASSREEISRIITANGRRSGITSGLLRDGNRLLLIGVSPGPPGSRDFIRFETHLAGDVLLRSRLDDVARRAFDP